MKKILMALLFYSFCSGAVIIETQNGANPTLAGFVRNVNGTTFEGFGSEYGEDYWYMNSTRRFYYQYACQLADFQDASGWTATWRTKNLLPNSAAVTDNFLVVQNGAYRFEMSIFGFTTPTMNPGVYANLKTGYTRLDVPAVNVDEYHTYQIIYDPNGTMTSFYIDGDLKGEYPLTSLYTTTAIQFIWGDQYSTTTAAHENRYTLARLEKGINPVKWVISGTPAAVEGETTTYQVKICGQPTAPVTVTLNGGSQLLVNGSPQTQLTFDNAVLPIPVQTVTVTAFDDSSQEDAHFGTITHSAASADAAYNFAMRNVVVNITDNDIAGVNITAEQFDVAETAAEPVSYELSLKSQPSSNVTFTFVTDSQISPIAPVVFNSSNWNVPQTVYIYVVNDNLSEGPHSSIISHTITSGDANYNNFCINNVVVNIEDDEPWCGQAGTMYFNADFNHDCYIDFADVQGMASVWLMSN